MSNKLTMNPAISREVFFSSCFFSIICAIGLIAMVGNATLGQQRLAPVNRLTPQSASQAGTDAASIAFRSSRDLITEQEWAKAQEKFSQYIQTYPNAKNIDAALYWLAYSQNKLAKFDQCRTTVTRLFNDYPNTSWREDARVLLAQVPGGSSAGYGDLTTTAARANLIARTAVDGSIVYAPVAPMEVLTPLPAQGIGTSSAWSVEGFGGSASDDDPCEFKIVVLQALFQTDLQRGIMAATEWLKPGSTQTVRCKGAALTLLGRNGGKAVTPVILGMAKNEPDLKLRARAISALGVTNDDSVIDSLRDFALNSAENNIVEASLYALSKHTGDRAIAVLTEIATSAKTTGQRKVAISSIASRAGEPAVDALLKIYDTDQSLEIRKAVISGFANRKSERAGNKLLEIARGSDNIELRKSAIGGISRRGGEKAVEFLLGLYDSEKNEELKDQIINSLGSGSSMFASYGVMAGQTIASGRRMEDQRVIRKLIEIAKSPQAPMERRKRAIGWLSRSKDPEVLKFLEELLK